MADVHVTRQIQGMAQHVRPFQGRCFGQAGQSAIFRQGVKPGGGNPEPTAGKGDGGEKSTCVRAGCLEVLSILMDQGKGIFQKRNGLTCVRIRQLILDNHQAGHIRQIWKGVRCQIQKDRAVSVFLESPCQGLGNLCLILCDINFSGIGQLNTGAVEKPDLLNRNFFQKKGLTDQIRFFKGFGIIIPV